MKHWLVPILICSTTPLTLAGQEPPQGLAEAESARSRACVPALAALTDLNARLEPLARRLDRLRGLDRSIALEDSTEVAPFDLSLPVDRAVRDWFQADGELARRQVAQGDSALLGQRSAGRTAIRERLRAELDSVRAEAERQVAASPDAEENALPCEGVVFVRGAVLEACAGGDGPLCEAAAASGLTGPFRFVDDPADIWGIEELRPWTDPGPLRRGPQGGLAGARTAAQARLGNVEVIVGLAPLLRSRDDLSQEETAEFEANLDSLGIAFEHPRLVMAPALEIQLRVAGPLGGETHYILHFGDEESPEAVWSAPAGTRGIVRAVFPAAPSDLARLRAGVPLGLTAVRISPEDETSGDAVYSIGLPTVNQQRAVGALLAYMGGGGLQRDLLALVPPGPGAGPE